MPIDGDAAGAVARITHVNTMFEQGRRVLRCEQTPPPIARLLGFVVNAIDPGHAVFQIAADQRRHNPIGMLHGGV